jgi:recombination protein RecR
MKIPKSITNLIESFEKLPGIGPRTAQRLAFYLLHVPQSRLDEFAENLSKLKQSTVICSVCKNVAEMDPCPICSDSSRDSSCIMVVEEPLDLIAFERTSKYKGLYHVLHGRISPLENIGPDEIYIDDLLSRVSSIESRVSEIIIATNPNMEGEATAMYIAKEIKKLPNSKIKITKLGMGIPTGADLEYADEVTLTQALSGRREL